MESYALVRSIKHTYSGNLTQYTMICSYVASNSVLFADGDITSTTVPSIRRGASQRDVWNAESPTKRMCLP